MRNKHEARDCSLNSQVSPFGGEGDDRLLTVLEAAHFLNLAPGSVYHLICQRRIPVVRISARCVRFSRAALQEWIESLSQEADEFSESKARSAIRKQTNSVLVSGHK